VANARFYRASVSTLGTQAFARIYRASVTVVGGTNKANIYRASVSVAATANAGVDQLGLEPYSVVTLVGIDDGGVGASRIWTQRAGTTVVLTDDGQGTATFVAPGSILGETLVFGYVSGSSTEDTVAASIEPVVARAVINGVEVPMQELWV
jgi:hypothetical protein